jgi:broad specificity phosphatase PhoE
MILLRHGQSEFNVLFSVDKRDPGIPDPPLTLLGLDQARAAAMALEGEGIRHIVVSPYRRALQTASVIAEHLGVAVVVNPQVRERCAFSCDIGTPASALARAWPGLRFDGLDEIWWPTVEEPVAAAGARAARFRQEIAALPDWEQVLVVSHWGFILALTGVRLQNGEWLRHNPTAPREAGVHSLEGPYLLKP